MELEPRTAGSEYQFVRHELDVYREGETTSYCDNYFNRTVVKCQEKVAVLLDQTRIHRRPDTGRQGGGGYSYNPS